MHSGKVIEQRHIIEEFKTAKGQQKLTSEMKLFQILKLFLDVLEEKVKSFKFSVCLC